MYEIRHPSYQKHWQTNKVSFDKIQFLTGLDKSKAQKLVDSLLGLGFLVKVEKRKKSNLDINGDGKVDKKDASLAGKVLRNATNKN